MQLSSRASHVTAGRGLRCGATRLVISRPQLHTAKAASSQAMGSTNASTEAWEKLQGLKVYRSSDGAEVSITDLWKDDERAVVAFARSFGCFFCWELATQLWRDVKPKLDAQGVKLYLVGVGTPARSTDFVRETGFPAENLLADPENVTYDALGLVRNVKQTFFDINTPFAFKKRMDEGRMGDLMNILPRWKPWNPPRLNQALQQGGMFVFQGRELLFSHKDAATADHADLQQVLGMALQGVNSANQEDCGCQPQA